VRLAVLGFALTFFVAGCVTPVIPLPPPAPKKLTQDLTTGEGSLEGVASEPGTLVYVFNSSTGTGVIATADSQNRFVTQKMAMADEDHLELWGSRFSEDSPSSIRCITVDSTVPQGFREECK
jgi:hypothetical protein